ncbi:MULTISPECIES: alpha/beta fold hydrolase [unclassified Pseudoalteromonas]|uniref:alpha/beta hydrolase n=1 Tax=unclassified Pseudoalteromonas TaxID=194690 RepID=UPI0020968EA1|nr:alpha/beta fold hydrolase [Pseudoalteromonas sp. XMcav2-N]MCO7187997.1 alpha/beta hydrolase [Pseudoalteromonas sp. XMcav2-N]
MITKYLTDMMTKGGRSPVFETPAQYGLNYKDVTFQAEDGVTLSGWLIEGSSDKVIIQSHFGVQCSRAGFTPEGKGLIKLYKQNISFLRQAKHLVEQGYSVLMYDLRNHGNSGQGTNPYIAWGSEEAKDVLAAVNFISTHPQYKESQIGLLSICMGTSSTSFAYGLDNGLQNYPNIKALISVQPLRYVDYMSAMGVPNFLAKRVNQYNIKRGGADLSGSFFEHVSKIKVPTLVIQNKNDPWTKLEQVDEYYQLLGGKKELLMLDLAKNRAAAYDWLGESPESLSAFFNKYM